MERLPSNQHEQAPDGGSRDHVRSLGVIALLRTLTHESDLRGAVSEGFAKVIAGALAPSEDSALADYVRGDPTTNRELRAEYLPLYHAPDADPAVIEAVDRLGCYLIDTENERPLTIAPAARRTLKTVLWQTQIEVDGSTLDVSVRGDTPLETMERLHERLGELIEKHGDSFIAFLDLTDVDAAASNLEETFDAYFYGSYPSKQTLLNDIAEYDVLEKKLRELQARFPAAANLELEPDEVWDRIEDNWEIVEFRNQYHVFNR